MVDGSKISTSAFSFAPESRYTVVMEGELLVWLSKGLFYLTEEILGRLDLWWSRTFGRPLSGRLGKLEIQTLFHGNTKDEDQI